MFTVANYLKIHSTKGCNCGVQVILRNLIIYKINIDVLHKTKHLLYALPIHGFLMREAIEILCLLLTFLF